MEAPPTSGTSGSGTTTMQHLNLDPEQLIVPEAIPIPGIAPEMLSGAASGVRTSGLEVEAAGQDIRTVWQALGSVYTAPESDLLLRAADPIANLGSKFGGKMVAAATVLQEFAESVGRLKDQLLRLRGIAQDFVDSVGDDWKEDSETVDKNVGMKVLANLMITSVQSAERECANKITGLFGGTTFVPANGGDPREGVIQYGATWDSVVNKVPEYNTFLVSSTGKTLDGVVRAHWESLGPGATKDFGLMLAASQGFYDPNTGWTIDPLHTYANRVAFATNLIAEGGNSVGIEFQEGTLIPTRWGLDVAGKHYHEQFLAFFPYTMVGQDPGYAYGTLVFNTAGLAAGGIAGRVLKLGKVVSAADGHRDIDVPKPGQGQERLPGDQRKTAEQYRNDVRSVVPELPSNPKLKPSHQVSIDAARDAAFSGASDIALQAAGKIDVGKGALDDLKLPDRAKAPSLSHEDPDPPFPPKSPTTSEGTAEDRALDEEQPEELEPAQAAGGGGGGEGGDEPPRTGPDDPDDWDEGGGAEERRFESGAWDGIPVKDLQQPRKMGDSFSPGTLDDPSDPLMDSERKIADLRSGEGYHVTGMKEEHGLKHKKNFDVWERGDSEDEGVRVEYKDIQNPGQRPVDNQIRKSLRKFDPNAAEPISDGRVVLDGRTATPTDVGLDGMKKRLSEDIRGSAKSDRVSEMLLYTKDGDLIRFSDRVIYVNDIPQFQWREGRWQDL